MQAQCNRWPTPSSPQLPPRPPPQLTTTLQRLSAHRSHHHRHQQRDRHMRWLGQTSRNGIPCNQSHLDGTPTVPGADRTLRCLYFSRRIRGLLCRRVRCQLTATKTRYIPIAFEKSARETSACLASARTLTDSAGWPSSSADRRTHILSKAANTCHARSLVMRVLAAATASAVLSTTLAPSASWSPFSPPACLPSWSSQPKMCGTTSTARSRQFWGAQQFLNRSVNKWNRQQGEI